MKKDREDTQAERKPILKELPLFRYVDRVMTGIDTALNLVAVGFIMFLMLFASSEIVGRYLFKYPIPGHVEIVELIMAAVVFFGIAYTQRVGGHIRMDMFITRVLRGRSYHIAEAITILFSLLGYSIITLASLKFALDAYEFGDLTTYIYWPTWPSKMTIPIGGFLLCARFFLQLIQHIAQAVVGVEIRDVE
jgi:TRAP-type C4-dicarboxylate transport system permease small subunit